MIHQYSLLIIPSYSNCIRGVSSFTISFRIRSRNICYPDAHANNGVGKWSDAGCNCANGLANKNIQKRTHLSPLPRCRRDRIVAGLTGTWRGSSTINVKCGLSCMFTRALALAPQARVGARAARMPARA